MCCCCCKQRFFSQLYHALFVVSGCLLIAEGVLAYPVARLAATTCYVMPGFGLLATIAGIAGWLNARKKSPFAIASSAVATALAATAIGVLALLAFFTDTGALRASCVQAMSPGGWSSSDQAVFDNDPDELFNATQQHLYAFEVLGAIAVFLAANAVFVALGLRYKIVLELAQVPEDTASFRFRARRMSRMRAASKHQLAITSQPSSRTLQGVVVSDQPSASEGGNLSPSSDKRTQLTANAANVAQAAVSASLKTFGLPSSSQLSSGTASSALSSRLSVQLVASDDGRSRSLASKTSPETSPFAQQKSSRKLSQAQPDERAVLRRVVSGVQEEDGETVESEHATLKKSATAASSRDEGAQPMRMMRPAMMHAMSTSNVNRDSQNPPDDKRKATVAVEETPRKHKTRSSVAQAATGAPASELLPGVWTSHGSSGDEDEAAGVDSQPSSPQTNKKSGRSFRQALRRQKSNDGTSRKRSAAVPLAQSVDLTSNEQPRQQSLEPPVAGTGGDKDKARHRSSASASKQRGSRSLRVQQQSQTPRVASDSQVLVIHGDPNDDEDEAADNEQQQQQREPSRRRPSASEFEHDSLPGQPDVHFSAHADPPPKHEHVPALPLVIVSPHGQPDSLLARSNSGHLGLDRSPPQSHASAVHLPATIASPTLAVRQHEPQPSVEFTFFPASYQHDRTNSAQSNLLSAAAAAPHARVPSNSALLAGTGVAMPSATLQRQQTNSQLNTTSAARPPLHAQQPSARLALSIPSLRPTLSPHESNEKASVDVMVVHGDRDVDDGASARQHAVSDQVDAAPDADAAPLVATGFNPASGFSMPPSLLAMEAIG